VRFQSKIEPEIRPIEVDEIINEDSSSGEDLDKFTEIQRKYDSMDNKDN
jgi:hypothetical protein